MSSGVLSTPQRLEEIDSWVRGSAAKVGSQYLQRTEHAGHLQRSEPGVSLREDPICRSCEITMGGQGPHMSCPLCKDVCAASWPFDRFPKMLSVYLVLEALSWSRVNQAPLCLSCEHGYNLFSGLSIQEVGGKVRDMCRTQQEEQVAQPVFFSRAPKTSFCGP